MSEEVAMAAGDIAYWHRRAQTAEAVAAQLRDVLAELQAARALAARLNARRGICPLCGFGTKLDGSEFHGAGCTLAAYNAVRKERDS